MMRWISKLFKTKPKEYKTSIIKVEHESSIITGVIGYNKPIEVIKECEVPCECRNCGTAWRQTLQNVYAVKNSVYEYDYCSQCTDITQTPYDLSTVDDDGNIMISAGKLFNVTR